MTKEYVTIDENNSDPNSIYYNTPRAWDILKRTGESLNFELAVLRHTSLLEILRDTPNDQELGAKVRELFSI